MKAILDNRLKTAAGFVTEGAYLVDVGTDHAKLPVYLISENRIERAIAADINEGPLAFAKELINRYFFDEKIKTVLTDGLSGIDLSEITDISICGMGGELISEILDRGFSDEYSHINFILNPMTKDDELRKYLIGNGFSIRNEKACVQSGKVYTVINAVFNNMPAEYSEITLLTGGFKGETPEERAYLNKLIKRLRKQMKDKNKVQASENTLKYLEELLGECR